MELRFLRNISSLDEYVLAPYVHLGLSGGVLKLGFGSIQQSIEDSKTQRYIIEFCFFMLNPRKTKEIEDFIQNIPEDLRETIIHLFENKPLLIDHEILKKKKERYNRHLLFYNLAEANPINVQKNLREKTVVILGCGGIGNVISLNLAVAGVGKLLLVDNDDVELSNLTRQIAFHEEDIGALKVDALKSRILQRTKEVTIETYNMKITKEEDLLSFSQADLIVVSGDSFGICNITNAFSYKYGVPFINVCYILDIAVFGPFIIPGKTPCYECFAKNNISNLKFNIEKDLEEKIFSINKAVQAPSFGPLNMLASSLACFDIFKFLGEFGHIHSLFKRVGLWSHDLHFQYQEYTKQKDCKICNIRR